MIATTARQSSATIGRTIGGGARVVRRRGACSTMSSRVILDDSVGDDGVARVDVLKPGEETRVGGALREG
eukprot:466061-Pyramimonas_sp.AAC.1